MQKKLNVIPLIVKSSGAHPFTLAQCFSTQSVDVVSKNYARFKTKYHEHVKTFQDKLANLEKQNTRELKAPTSKAYTHPYHSDHHPLVFSSVKTAELFHDAVGPEQVSPHYENFLVSRKFAMGWLGGAFALGIGASTVDLHWIAKSSFLPFMFWMQMMYFYLEGRKSFFKPLLVRFYRRVASNEIYNFEVYYHENIEVRIRELLRVAKHQLEYYEVHQNFQEIKAESINMFLANEHLNLQRHITERTLNILKQVEVYEENNKQRYLQGIIQRASSEIDRQLTGSDAEKIQQQMLDSAIEGLSKGYMDYANDPILPLVQQSIRSSVESLNKLSATEQAKLQALTKEQLQSIRDSDRKAKEEFLTTQPAALEGGLKNNDVVKKILSTWGK